MFATVTPRSGDGGSPVIVARWPPSTTVCSAVAAPPRTAFTAVPTPRPLGVAFRTKPLGARVTATASAGDIEYVRSLGADVVIDYKATPFEEVVSDVDVVLDPIGGRTAEASLGVLNDGGSLISLAGPRFST